MSSIYELPVFTTSPSGIYDSIGIVSHYHAGMFTKSKFGKEMLFDDLIQEFIKIIVNKAKELHADSIYGLRIDVFPGPGSMATTNNFNVYGTAIKLLKDV